MTDKDFEEIQEFGETIGLPESSEKRFDAPYALLIEEIDHSVDRERVYQVLSESGVDLDLEAVKKQLDEGHVLVSHLNEAKAAMIADKIKDIDVEIRFGLLDEICPLRGGEARKTEEKGAIARQMKPDISKEGGVVLTTAPSIEGVAVKKYLGIVSADIFLPEEAVTDELEREILGEERGPYDKTIADLLKILEQRAREKNANAVIAISFDFKSIPEKKAFLVFAVGTAIQF